MITYTLLERDRMKFEEGVEQGIEKGERARALEVAKNLLEIGMEIDQIAKVTNLTKEEVLGLKWLD